MPLSPGACLGPYEIVAPIGAGGMGEVYRARDFRLRREVAAGDLARRRRGDEAGAPGRVSLWLLEGFTPMCDLLSRLDHHLLYVRQLARVSLSRKVMSPVNRLQDTDERKRHEQDRELQHGLLPSTVQVSR